MFCHIRVPGCRGRICQLPEGYPMKYKIVRITVIGIICIFCIGYLFSCYDGKKYNIDNVEDYVRKVCEMGNVPGMSIVVLDNGQEYYLNTGYVDKNKKEPMTNEVRCELGSTTKAFTALGVLLLEQDGRLDREDSVKDYLTWFRPTYDGKEVNITIEHLLCHTSGIPVWTIAKLPTGSIDDVGLLENTVKEIQSVKLDSMPGTVHNYATINYDVLALIIEKASGMTYEEYIEKNVLEPLGMLNSYFRVDDSKSEQLAQGHRYAFMRARKYDAPTFYGNTAAGYLVSNTNDLSIWMKAQMGILEMDMTEKINRAIMESHLYPMDEGQHYFAGWNLYDTYFCHGGNNPNFSSQVIIGRTNKKGVFALANICGSAPAKAADGIYHMMQGETVEIGFWMDGNSLVDLLCVIGCLFEIYIMVLLFERRGRVRYVGTKVFFYLMTALIVLLVPYILHYNYFTLAVWFSPCLFIAIAGAEICFTEYIVSCICNHKKSDER